MAGAVLFAADTAVPTENSQEGRIADAMHDGTQTVCQVEKDTPYEERVRAQLALNGLPRERNA